MKKPTLAVLFSGGKDSTLALYKAQQQGYPIACLISLVSENKDSYMFHTPVIEKTPHQARALNIPLITQPTAGKKETELKDLKKAIKRAIKEYKIMGIVTGAVESIYQSSRIQRICNDLAIECFNPLWQKPQTEILKEIIQKKFKVIVTAVAAYPLTKDWLGREINEQFITDITELQKKFKINPAGEGGEYETFVLNGPNFTKPLSLDNKKESGKGNSWRLDFER